MHSVHGLCTNSCAQFSSNAFSSNPIRLDSVRIGRNGLEGNLWTKLNWTKSRSPVQIHGTNYVPHTQIHLLPDCIPHLPIDLAPNWRPLDSKSIGKWWIQSNFYSMLQDCVAIPLLWNIIEKFSKVETNGNVFWIFNEYIFHLPQGALTRLNFAFKISQNIVSSMQKLITQ